MAIEKPQLRFHITGHKNIRGTHPSTIEFTRDHGLSPKGDCILGIEASFTPSEIERFMKQALGGRHNPVPISIEIYIEGSKEPMETLTALLNPGFHDTHEMVLRTSDFHSGRTFGIRASKAAAQLNRGFIEKLRDPKTRAEVVISATGR